MVANLPETPFTKTRIRRPLPRMLQLCEYLSGCRDEPPPDCEGFMMSDHFVVGRHVPQVPPDWALYVRYAGEWFFLFGLRPDEPLLAEVREAGRMTKTPKRVSTETERRKAAELGATARAAEQQREFLARAGAPRPKEIAPAHDAERPAGRGALAGHERAYAAINRAREGKPSDPAD